MTNSILLEQLIISYQSLIIGGRQRRKKEKLLLKAVNVYFSVLFLAVKLIFGLRDNLFALNSLEHHFLKFIMQNGNWYK